MDLAETALSCLTASTRRQAFLIMSFRTNVEQRTSFAESKNVCRAICRSCSRFQIFRTPELNPRGAVMSPKIHDMRTTVQVMNTAPAVKPAPGAAILPPRATNTDSRRSASPPLAYWKEAAPPDCLRWAPAPTPRSAGGIPSYPPAS